MFDGVENTPVFGEHIDPGHLHIFVETHGGTDFIDGAAKRIFFKNVPGHVDAVFFAPGTDGFGKRLYKKIRQDEEVAAKKMSLSQIANYIADSVEKRAAKGMNFGLAIIPEGVVEFVPEFSKLIQEINELLAGSKADAFNALPNWKEKYAFIEKGLTSESMSVFEILPEGIQQQLFTGYRYRTASFPRLPHRQDGVCCGQ